LKKLLLLLLLAGLAAAIVWGILHKSEPPRVAFAQVQRQTLVSTIPTNGKVEPFEWQAMHADAAGPVVKVDVREGDTVSSGAVVVTLGDPAIDSEIDAVEARLAEARAGLAALEAGGRPAEFADIDNQLARARAQLEDQTTELNTLRRLVEKRAATAQEMQAAQAKIGQTQLEIDGLAKRRGALVAPADVTAAQARIRDAQAAVNLARGKSRRVVVRAPIAGTIYGLAARPGSFLAVGDLVANVGRMDRLRVRVYVDEPELGRVARGQPVVIAWQALPGRKWEGTVERKPTSIQALGSRQVGEVVCDIENSGRELIPGTNVDAEIRTSVVQGALVIPREALRRDAGGDFVLALKDGAVERRAVRTGASSVAMVEISSGLAEGDRIALPSDTSIQPGDKVAVR
jgi:HlyD family secretion protein